MSSHDWAASRAVFKRFCKLLALLSPAITNQGVGNGSV